MTQLAKAFKKRWRNWLLDNKKVVTKFEELEGKALIRVVGPKNRPQTYVGFILALRVLHDYDASFSWHILTAYKNSLEESNKKVGLELKGFQERSQLLEAENAQLKNKAIEVNLVGGEFLLYAYLCNNIVKFGTSFCNKNGQRPKSHKTSVPNLSLGFVIYASKEHLQQLNKAIKYRFKIKGRGEHVHCHIDELEHFAISYLKIMNFEFKQEKIQTLKLLNIFLKS